MDYTPVSRSLTFNAAVISQMVEVPIIDDHNVEHSEIINLTLLSTDSAVILNPSTSTITIEDVDSKLHTVCTSQRRRRHFKSGQATANKRSLVHVHGGQCAA